MSASAASSIDATTRRARASTTSAASWTALPASCNEREPNVPTPWGTIAVSECTTRTSSNGTPNTADVIWAHAVSWPWPFGTLPVTTVAVPSASMVTDPYSPPRPLTST